MKALKTLAAALATIALTACTLHEAEAPPSLTGPSGPAQTISISATPDSISQDGSSTSTITVTAAKNGQPLANLELRFDMKVNNAASDLGTLRPGRSARTDASGLATVIYTAPPRQTVGPLGKCQGHDLLGYCVDIIVTPTGSAFEASVHPSVQIRLVPPSVIVPAPDPAAPVARFTAFPIPIKVLAQAFFNASSSTATAGRTITSYAWDFGDGTRKSGVNTQHDFDLVGVYFVTLTVTDNAGLQGVFTSAVDVQP
jgi:PKD repeat protein